MGRRHTLRGDQWARIKEQLPGKRSKKGRPRTDDRMMVEGMLWVLKTGAPWRDLPERFGPWQTVYARWAHWSRSGIWKQLLDELAKDANDEAFMIDASIVRAHQDASGAPKKTVPRRSVIREAVRPQKSTL